MNTNIKYLIPDSICSGIYKITTSDGYYYIGSTNTFKHRYREHLSTLINKKSMNPHMVNRFHARSDTWTFELLEEVILCDDWLLLVEQRYLDEHYGAPKCMNINPIAIKPPSRKGCKLTEEQKAKKRGRKLTEEHKRKIGLSSIGRVLSEETKAKLSAFRTGRKVPEGTKVKLAALPQAFKPGRVPWNKGLKYHHS